MKNCINYKIQQYIEALEDTPVSGLHKMVMQKTEKELINTMLIRNKHNQTKTAQELGINRLTLRNKIKQYGITKF